VHRLVGLQIADGGSHGLPPLLRHVGPHVVGSQAAATSNPPSSTGYDLLVDRHRSWGIPVMRSPADTRGIGYTPAVLYSLPLPVPLVLKQVA
jgi:hypothetical protein